jgi:hypothetical protein
VLSLFNIMIVDKKVQPNKHVHPPFQSTTWRFFLPTWR